ncbi:uncharacterized protein LOC127443438 isoform X2 [Myxocyprinus asiaticus]|uniref:uncharacterized protein LOC127443438 isoform X2 n=1 Tax=Myxocyprinus asiaticus TaxID=70543 RepID=UPI002222E317|nr:uncharacterized protein LOC127443438 isoform X2 [Myxocyprinus asiaticus]
MIQRTTKKDKTALALCHYLESNKATVDLLEKAVLEIGAGTGLVSIVASLLGAWVTATDLPEVLGNLRCNLSRNTRGRCRYTPQVAALSWGHDLEKTFSHSVYKYDYVMAADVVYHHDFLAELLVTMQHFCQPGTTLIWANKIRFESDLVFTDNFKKTFNTILLEDNGEVKIYSATMKEESGLLMSEVTKEVVMQENKVEMESKQMSGEMRQESEIINLENNCEETQKQKMMENGTFMARKVLTDQAFIEIQDHGQQEMEKKPQFREALVTGQGYMQNQVETLKSEDGHLNNKEEGEEEDNTNCETETEESEDAESFTEMDSTDETFTEQKSEESSSENVKQQDFTRSWVPTVYYSLEKEIHYFLGQKITIQESIDSYGATIWPAALALCRFLETPQGRQQINLLDKSVLELGAGTGLLSVVATLLGAKLTATDLPEILSNLTCNLNRNTRGRRRHEPLVKELYWGHMLEENFPKSTHHYDYVLATDVVYHHNYLSELLVTMRYFCQPGTTLVWANKIRYASDLGFIDDFQTSFNSTMIIDLDDVRIYVATSNTSEVEDDQETNEEEEDKEESKKKD